MTRTSERVLVTGTTGFVGRMLCASLTEAGYRVRAALRTAGKAAAGVECVLVGDIGPHTDWESALRGSEFVVHLAARAHVLGGSRQDVQCYFDTNAEGTGRLAREAARLGVRRMVYLSSIKVNGEGRADRGYTSSDAPDPQDAYGSSKWQGECLLAEAAAGSTLENVTVRAPLVYGPGVRANFLRLLHRVDHEGLFPLGSVHNERSLVSVWNLCDLLVRMLRHPAAAGGTWMVSDGDDISTAELVRRLAALLGRRARVVATPLPLLRLVGGLLGRSAEVRRLCGSLKVDIAQTRQQLQWSPPVSLQDALARTVDWYRRQDS